MLLVGLVPLQARYHSWWPGYRVRGRKLSALRSKLISASCSRADELRSNGAAKPVWVVRRGSDSLDVLPSLDDGLRDPRSEEDQQPDYARNTHRSIKPEYLVLVGICTHLGCSPAYVTAKEPHSLGGDWEGGFFCPCHGSRFDLAGRVFNNVPAPTNLPVPPHHYIDNDTILIGVDQGAA